MSKRNRYSAEEIVNKLREAEVLLSKGPAATGGGRRPAVRSLATAGSPTWPWPDRSRPRGARISPEVEECPFRLRPPCGRLLPEKAGP